MSPPARRLTLIAMWGAAIAAMLYLWIGREEARTHAEEFPTAPGVPVRGEAFTETETEAITDGETNEASARRYRGDTFNRGQSGIAGPTEATLAWTFDTEGRITAQPVADEEGRIYVASHSGTLYALDERGAKRWEHDLGGPIYSTPYLDERGNLYVGSDAQKIYSFDPRGRLRWRLDTDGDADTGIVPAPDGTLRTAAGREILAIDPRRGTVVWRFSADEKVFGTPAIDAQGRTIVGSQDDHVYCLSPSGELVWRYQTGADNDASPLIGEDGTIYLGSDDRRFYALTPDGELRWSTALDGMIRAPAALGREGSVLVGVFGPRPRLVALTADTGELRWYFPVTLADTTEIGVSSGPLVDAAGQIYFGAHDDYLYSLDANGQLRWIFEAQGDIDAHPILTPSGLLLVGSDDGNLYAFR